MKTLHSHAQNKNTSRRQRFMIFLHRSIVVLVPVFAIIIFQISLAAFGAPLSYSVGNNPRSVFSADFDGDGDLDLAVANYNSNTVSVLLNNGDGTFVAAVNYGVGSRPSSVFAADLDGDGDQDLAVTNYVGDNLSILLNNGDGTFAAAVNYAAGDGAWSVFAADLDGDSDLDLAVSNSNTTTVSVFINNGDGTLLPAVDYTVQNVPSSVYATDFDGDGKPDLAVSNYFSGTVSILINNGDGTFAAAVNYAAVNNPIELYAADLDGDGDQDLAMANYDNSNTSVMLNNGAGTFAATVDYGVGSHPTSVFAADLDGDGDQDLVATNYSSGTVSVLSNNGDGTFVAAVNYAAGNGPWSAFAADLDADGDLDLAVANYNNAKVSILLSDLAPAPATLHIVKQVVNASGGIATASDFNLHVTLAGVDVAGSPAVGADAPGTLYTLSAGTYVVSEDANPSYLSGFSGDCDAGGSITLIPGDDKTCTVTNTDIPPLATLHVIKQVVNDNGRTATAPDFNLHVTLAGVDVAGSPAVGADAPGTLYTLSAGTYVVSEDANPSYLSGFSGDCDAGGSITLIPGDDKTCTLTNDDIAIPGGGGGGGGGGGAGGSAQFGAPSCTGPSCISNDDSIHPVNNTPNPSTPALPEDSHCDRTATSIIPFQDISHHWGRYYIENLYRQCIIDGRTANLFVPDGESTRAELVKIASNTHRFGKASFERLFRDVTKNNWFATYVISAAKLKIVEGYIIDTGILPFFKPNQSITRAEALKILLKAKGITDFGDFEADFLDVSKDDWFYSIVAYAQANNIVEGYSNTDDYGASISDKYFRPNQHMIRAEAAKLAVLTQN